jgi:hypothetical protein
MLKTKPGRRAREVAPSSGDHESALSGSTAALALLGAALGFLGGLWLFAQAGWLWMLGLPVAVVGCWLCVLVIARAGDDDGR